MDHQDNSKKKIMYSAIKSTGYSNLGNYLGALRNWKNMQDGYLSLFCVADLHSLTIRQEPAELRKKSKDMFTLFLALGLDPDKSILYMQSQVSAHAELCWILNCYTYMGELSRMTQFKDKSQKHSDNINAGLFDYPVLMAADILLYQPDLVPVGEDQRQHVEICRDIAIRFNNIYGEVFKVPEVNIPKVGARIMDLQEPDKKMSKSDGEAANGVIFMMDTPDIINAKIKRAVTDSDALIKFTADKPGVSNLLTIYSSATGLTIAQAEEEFTGSNYGVLKKRVAEAVIAELTPIQERFQQLAKDKDYIESTMKQGAEKAAAMGNRTLAKVKKKIGLVV